MVKITLTVLIGLAGGLAVGTSVSAFLTVLGIPARLIQWTRSDKPTLLFEVSIILGVIASCLIYFFDFSLVSLKIPPADILSVPVGFLVGIFVGLVSAALTETLDIISISAKKLKIVKWIYLIVAATLLGKMIGSLLFFIIPGFH